MLVRFKSSKGLCRGIRLKSTADCPGQSLTHGSVHDLPNGLMADAALLRRLAQSEAMDVGGDERLALGRNARAALRASDRRSRAARSMDGGQVVVCSAGTSASARSSGWP
jgi:hypothetical protein